MAEVPLLASTGDGVTDDHDHDLQVVTSTTPAAGGSDDDCKIEFDSEVLERVDVLEEGVTACHEKLDSLNQDVKVLLVEMNIVSDWVKNKFGVELFDKDAQIFKQIQGFEEIKELSEQLALVKTGIKKAQATRKRGPKSKVGKTGANVKIETLPETETSLSPVAVEQEQEPLAIEVNIREAETQEILGIVEDGDQGTLFLQDEIDASSNSGEQEQRLGTFVLVKSEPQEILKFVNSADSDAVPTPSSQDKSEPS